MACTLGEAILRLLKKKLPKIRKQLATYTLEHPEHIPKEFGFPTLSYKVASRPQTFENLSV